MTTEVHVVGEDARSTRLRALVARSPRLRASSAGTQIQVGRGTRGIVAAPVDTRSPWSPAAQLAAGWLLTRGAQRRADAGSIALSGTFEGSGAPTQILVQAALLLRRLCPRGALRRVDDRGHTLVWGTARNEISLRWSIGSPRLHAQLRRGRESWTWDVTLNREALNEAERPLSDLEERVLGTLLHPAGLANASEVEDALETLRSVVRAHPRLGLASLSDLRDSLPRTGLARLGLQAEEPAPTSRAPAPLAPAPLAGPTTALATQWEALAFRAGLKPVVYWTFDDEGDIAPALASLGDVESVRFSFAESRNAQDERVRTGAARIAVFASRERSLAERAATMQQEDPSKHAAAIGTLLGYPRCCIDAFLSQTDRSNNSFNRYATAQRTDAEMWPWELADLRTKIYPFYPCRYDCPTALTFARQTLAQLDASDFEATRRRLARPVLYFDDQHQLVF
ncbi:MAG: hypothetical protein AAGE52_35485, partial [Myxococcota bacterium]